VGRGALSRARSVAVNVARDGVCMAYVVVPFRRSSRLVPEEGSCRRIRDFHPSKEKLRDCLW
jgi:hypothetical protein